MNIRRRVGFIGGGVGLCLFVSGCANGASEAAKTIVRLQRMARQSSPNSASSAPLSVPKANIDLTKLTPFSGGKGLVVCEPIAKGDAATANFGAGCTRWLHLCVSGQGALAQTPMWDPLNAARREMRRADLRLGLADSVKLAKKLGVNYVATSEIGGTAGNTTLTLQLWKMPGQQPVGQPLSISGSQAQIVQALPGLALKLSAALGLSGLKPIPLGASAGDMQFLGPLQWVAGDYLPPVQQARLKKLAATSPLAAMLQLSAMGTEAWMPAANSNWPADLRVPNATLLKVVSYNTLALTENAYFDVGAAEKKAIDALSLKYPQNYLVTTAEVLWQRKNEMTPGRPKELAAAQKLVRAAPNNPIAWLALADTLSGLADDVRHSRYSSELSTNESAYIEGLYPIAYAATSRATKLDPGSFFAQYDNSCQATFGGSMPDAYASVWKAIAIRPHDYRPWRWALQIYQSKWGGNTQDLMKVIEKIKADDDLYTGLYRDVHFALAESNLEQQMNEFDNEFIAKLNARLGSSPNDPLLLRKLADTLYFAHRYKEAGPIFLKLTQLDPKNAEAHYYYGWVEHYMNRHYRKAEVQYIAAIALAPRFSEAINALADITYYVHGDAVKAEALYRRAISIKNDGLYQAELARLMLDKGRHAAAMGRARMALRLGYNDHANPIWQRLGIDPGG